MFLKSQYKKLNLKDTKAIIFDFDGTLVDTEHVWTSAKIQISKQVAKRDSKSIDLYLTELNKKKFMHQLKSFAVDLRHYLSVLTMQNNPWCIP